MLNKLVGFLQKERSSHPLGSPQNIDQTLGEIPVGDAARVLVDIDNLLDDFSRYDTELPPDATREALIQIDTFARPFYDDLLQNYLLPGTRAHGEDLAWVTLDKHVQVLCAAYRHCLLQGSRDNDKEERTQGQRMAMALCAARAIDAWVEHKKLLHCRYRPADSAWWETVHELIGLANGLGVMRLSQTVYPEQTPARSCLHAYMAGLYFELAPVSNLIPLQFEVLQRWLQQHAAAFELTEVPHDASTHVLDIAMHTPPQRFDPQRPLRGTRLHYCSTRRMRGNILKLAQFTRPQATLPEWLQPFHTYNEQITGLVELLLRHWAEQPPERSSAREAGECGLRVVSGLSLARRMIACSAYARSGRSLNYRGTELSNLFNEYRFGRGAVANADEPPPDPMETLLRLETSGDKQMMEEWRQSDVSAQGLGATSLTLRSRNRIGELISYRREGEIEWCLGILRRISRTPQRRFSYGLETLPGPAQCAQVRNPDLKLGIWAEAFEAGNGFIDAIMLAPESQELLLPTGLFSPALVLTLVVDGKQSSITLTEIIDQGNEWERVRFQPTPQEAS
ncbi:MAG TPA: hypothetical protein VL550_10920 [Rhodocyclaceae bacterium]|jgi:hypothetical protein|nr:hypothetical protein [Rhodocyclaceae bacterium]